MKLVEKYKELLTKRPTIIALQKTSEDDSNNLFKILDIITPRNPAQDNKKLSASDDIWKMIPYKQFTPEEKYEKYKKIMDRAKKAKGTKHLPRTAPLKSSSRLSDSGGSLGRNKKTYCICQKPYKGELMICCENCQQWYHPKCVGIRKTVDLENLKWYCIDCQRKQSRDTPGSTAQNLTKRRNEQSLEEDNTLVKKLKTEKRTSARLAK